MLVIDDWGVSKLSAKNRRDLLETIEDRHGLSSTIVTSQLPVENWHAVIGDPTLTDAILDRLVHNAYQLNLKEESMRKRRRPLTRHPSPGRLVTPPRRFAPTPIPMHTPVPGADFTHPLPTAPLR